MEEKSMILAFNDQITVTGERGGADAFVGSYAVLSLIFILLQVIANWRIYTKAGESGWKSLIPLYTQYIAFKIAWKTSMFWLMLLVTVAAYVMIMLSTVIPALAFIFMWLIILCCAVLTIIGIVFSYKLSRAFGHGVGYTLGLIFLNPIFILILGLGKSQYIGADL